MEPASSTPSSSLPKTNWPVAVPDEREEMVVSISCGNSHLHWATHHGSGDEFSPKIFWRTPHLSGEDMTDDALAVLSRNLPDDPHDYVFGGSEASAENAEKQAAQRAVPHISVYVVSSNSAQATKLAQIWGTVPSRFYVMQGDDFFKKSQGRYDTMGTDRLATLTGATFLYGAPALVFDGGTATTYSGTNCAGEIMGGGIGPGLAKKFQSLASSTELPSITPEAVIARLQEAQAAGKPIETFANNTEDAMMSDVFQDFAFKGRNIVSNWLEKNKKGSAEPKEGTKINVDRAVCCTGGDCDILQLLLQPHFGGIIEQHNGHHAKSEYIVEVNKHLIHYGVAAALLAQVYLKKKKDEFCEMKIDSHVGKRVAKVFDVESDTGDNIYRGRVEEVIDGDGDGDTMYRIKYDDGDAEDVAIDGLFELINNFSVYGEKTPTVVPPPKGASGAKKKATVKTENKVKTDDKKSPSKAAPKKKNVEASTSDRKRAAPAAKTSAAKKAKTDPITALVNESNPRSFVRQRISKDFGGETYFGTVMEYDDKENPAFWHVEYDDGDEEDYSKRDLIKSLKHYDMNKASDPVKATSSSESRARSANEEVLLPPVMPAGK